MMSVQEEPGYVYGATDGDIRVIGINTVIAGVGAHTFHDYA